MQVGVRTAAACLTFLACDAAVYLQPLQMWAQLALQFWAKLAHLRRNQLVAKRKTQDGGPPALLSWRDAFKTCRHVHKWTSRHVHKWTSRHVHKWQKIDPKSHAHVVASLFLNRELPVKGPIKRVLNLTFVRSRATACSEVLGWLPTPTH